MDFFFWFNVRLLMCLFVFKVYIGKFGNFVFVMNSKWYKDM